MTKTEGVGTVVGGLVLIAFIVFLVWEFQPIDGTVTSKQFTPAHYETRWNRSCTTIRTGKSTTVKSCTSTPYTVFVMDNWSMTVCDEHRCKPINISETVYGDIRVGQHYSEKGSK